MADQVVIASIDQAINQVDRSLSVAPESSSLDCLVDTTKTASNVAAVSLIHESLCLTDLLYILSEDKHIVHADFLSNLHIGTVHCSDDKTTIHHKLHVGGSRSLCSSS